MDTWLSNVYKAFIYVSAILFMISLNTTGNTTINASISGYATTGIAMLLIMSLILNGLIKTIKGASTFQILTNILITIGPFILVLGIIGFLMYLLITYKNIIIEDHVSKYYGTFQFLSSVLILVQMYILYDGLDSEKFKTTNRLSKITSSILCLTAVLNIICVIILYITLKYYTTDG